MNAEKDIVLTVENLSAGYGSQTVLEGVSLKVQEGEILGIIGENGTGKSTLLKAISGLIPYTSGTVTFNGRRRKKEGVHNLPKQGISFFTQGGLIMPDLTVQEHLALAAMANERKNGKANFSRVFDKFPKLSEHRYNRAGKLSGGERQMLSFGILMVQGTDIWLLDEPTAGLSPDLVKQTTDFLEKMNRKEGITMVLVEHNMDVALYLSDHVTITKEGTLTRRFTQAEFSDENFLNNFVYN